MNTLQLYKAIRDTVTRSNNLCVKLDKDEITKKDAEKAFRQILAEGLKKLDS